MIQTVTMVILVGGTTSLLGSVTDALRLSATTGATAIQISLGPPDSKTVKQITAEDARTVQAIRKKHGFYVAVHGKYFYNFCRTEAWQAKLLLDELTQAVKIGAAVIIHQGKNMPELGLSRADALQTYVTNITEVLSRTPLETVLIIENSARQGTELGYGLDDLKEIFSLVPVQYRPRIGFCLDLCHVFVAGELNVCDGVAVTEWFGKMEHYGLPLKVVHFNDSAIPFNGANDNHAALGQGYIGSVSTGGFERVISYCQDRNIPMILETPATGHTSEIKYIKSVAAAILS